jgi:carboxyl-terminal processing protease
MSRRLPLNWLIVAVSLVAALLLTVFRQSPEGLLTIGLGDREVRAAPGEPAGAVKAKHNLTALRVFNLALVRIRDSYVDPARIDPKKMLFAALDSVQFNIPEVLIDPYPERDEVTVVVNDKRSTFSTDDVDSPWRLSGKLKKIFQFIQTNMNPGADLAEVEYAAVNGMLSTLDPHSVLLDPESAKEMDISTSGAFGGLGIVIGMRKNKLTVIRPMVDTPAHRAGVKAGDQIFRINEEPTEHLTLQEAVNRMRGRPGSKVKIVVKRKEKDAAVAKELDFEIVRDTISVPSVEGKMLSNNVGYMRIKTFSSETSREVKALIHDLEAKGAAAWVLDLRWNPGGLLEQAIQVSDIFVDRGTIVTTVSGQERDARRANKEQSKIGPVAVLVNGSSASASEIVAGALKNLDRAVIIGGTTFGKGSVQILYDNNDGSKLKLTIAEYLTPGDLSIQSLGIPPDIELVRMYLPKAIKTPADQVRLLRTKHTFREADLDSHLISKHAKEGPGPAEIVKFLYEPPDNPDALEPEEGEDAAHPLEAGEEEPIDVDEIRDDFEIRFARDLVATVTSTRRSEMLEQAKKLLVKRRAAEQKKVEQGLAVLGVDWSAAPRKEASKAQLQATIKFETETGKPLPSGRVAAGETIKITGTVTNTGTGPAYRVLAWLKAEDRIFDETELVFGRVDPGQSRTFHTLLKIPADSLDRVDPIEVLFREANGARVAAAPVKLRIESLERPVFAYAHQLIDAGNGDGLVQKDEPLKLHVTLKNIGKGKAHEAEALLSNASGGNVDGVVIEKGRYRFEKGLAAGEQKTIEFEFVANDKFNRDELVLELMVYDPVLRETVGEKLKYPLQSPSAGPQPARGVAQVTRDDAQLREGASNTAQVIGVADRGAAFKLTGQQGEYLRVEVEPGRPAFIATSAAKKSASGKPRAAGFDPVWQVTPPMLALQLPAHETAGDHYLLKGKATDDTHVEDVYIFVSNRDAKIANKKVFYQSNRGSKRDGSLEFAHDIPLWPGSNLVTVVARQDDEVKSSRFLYIYRSGGAPTVAKTQPDLAGDL